MSERKKVWDIPVRVFHWSLGLLIVASWWTGENGYYEWHEKSGLAIISLITFRLLWGIVGSETARFGHFVKAPGQALKDLRDFWEMRTKDHVGLDALGGYAVLVLLGAVLSQALLGLFAHDDLDIFYGPWADLVSEETSAQLASWHVQTFDILVILIVLHVTAVAAYIFLQGKDLLIPMITGMKDTEQPAPAMARPGKALAVAALGVVIGWGGVGAVEALFG